MIRLYVVNNNDNFNLQHVISDIDWLNYYNEYKYQCIVHLGDGTAMVLN